MSDDKTNRGPADRSRIIVEQDYERQFWTQRFGVSEEELRAAVHAVGSSAANVKEYLNEHRLLQYLRNSRRKTN